MESKARYGQTNGSYKHGLNKSGIYKLWNILKSRCYNKNRMDYKFYGGRGIKICAEWENDFLAFYNWAVSNGWEKGLQIDRIDNSKGYEPGNCVFVTSLKNNAVGRRRMRSDNSTGYTGVSFDKKANKFTTRIMIRGENVTIGYYTDVLLAAKARIDKEIELFGEQKTNFHFMTKEGLCHEDQLR